MMRRMFILEGLLALAVYYITLIRDWEKRGCEMGIKGA
jgi:hypothetical protein